MIDDEIVEIVEPADAMADPAAAFLDRQELSTGHLQRGEGAGEADAGALAESLASIPDIPLDSDAPTPCAFITGCAGTGKSTLLRERIAADPQYAILAASTGIAAVNLGTVTIHSMLGFFDTDSLRDAYIKGQAQRRLAKLADEGFRNVVVDECSMLSRDVLDVLVRVFDDVNLRRVEKGDRAVGLILCGDACLGKGTPVMRYDGSIILSEEVRVGDVLMGPDFQPRIVKKTCTGTDHLYRVKQTNGDDYTVNSRHRLALRRSAEASQANTGPYHNLLRYAYMPAESPVVVTDLLNKSKHFRECFVGYKAGCVPLAARDLKLDPYFLGLWLGDGDKDRAAITNSDPEVKDFWYEYAASFGLQVVVQRWARTESVKLTMVLGGKNGRKPNPVITLLKEYGLHKNKHIPEDFMLNSVENRLSLLAGLLDSDGSWGGSRYQICQVREGLAKQIKQLADGLGFRTGWREITSASNFGSIHSWNVTIGGDTWRIPCRVARKRSFPRSLGRSRLTSVLAIEPVGVGEYFGFEVDGDSRFLLGDGTVTYNCQLPPIADRPAGWHPTPGHRSPSLPTPWCFDSTFWPRFERNTTHLTKVWRQADPRFLAALNFARAGRGRDCLQVLQSAGQKFEQGVDMQFPGTTVVGKNDEVDRVNQIRLDREKGRLIQLPSRRWAAGGRVRPEWKHIPERTILREGAYVMILANQYASPDPGGGMIYANGDCGWVRGIQTSQDKLSPPTVMVELVRTGEVVHVASLVRDISFGDEPGWIGAGVTWAEQGKEDDGRFLAQPHKRKSKGRWVVGQLEYFPLRLAYASTVHKVQGLSLDRVQVDIRTWNFKTPGMVYVAFSRARTMEGLRVVGTPELLVSRCKVDQKVVRWL